MMTNMKTVLFTDDSIASPSGPDGLTKAYVFNGDNCPLWEYGVNMVWSGVIGNELIGPSGVSQELKLWTANMYCLCLKNSTAS